MRKLRATSLCLVFALMLGIGSSCANLPGSTADTNTAPPAADIPITEEEIVGAPVDLSGLTKEELGKLTYGMKQKLAYSYDNEDVIILITLTAPVDEVKFEQLVEEKQSYNNAMIKKIEAELNELSDELKSASLSESRASEINAEKEKLTEELSDYSVERNHCVNQIVAEVYEPDIAAFAEKYGLKDYNTIAAVSTISRVVVPASMVPELASDDRVACIDDAEANELVFDLALRETPSADGVSVSYDTIYPIINTTELNEIYDIVDGEKAVSAGHRGSGIVVGMIETGVPNASLVSGVTHYNATTSHITAHATAVAQIIKKMAPSCTIIATRIYGTIAETVGDLLSNNSSIDVICISAGTPSNGYYTNNANLISALINMYKIPICCGSGNYRSEYPEYDYYVTQQSLSPNVISVGAVRHSGTDPDATSAFSIESICQYKQDDGSISGFSMINKPDISAPGDSIDKQYVDGTIEKEYSAQTSFSNPVAVGAIVQMMSANSRYTADYTDTIHRDILPKATLMASCFYNGGSPRNIPGIISSDKEGAGVINAGACYEIASNHQYDNYTITSVGTIQKRIGISDTQKPLRVAIAWNSQSGSATNFNNAEINLHVYKENGSSNPIARSAAPSYLTSVMINHPVTNYEYVEIPASTLQELGAGVYIISIITTGIKTGSLNTRLSLAWCQYQNTDA